MRIFSSSLFFIVFFVILTLFFHSNTDLEAENILNNISNIHDTTFNLTNTISYSNLYEEEITIKKVMYNVINPIIYAIVVEINTLIPLATYVASGSYASILMRYLIVIGVFYLLFAIPNLIKAVISVYFFVKEKRKYKKEYKERIWH